MKSKQLIDNNWDSKLPFPKLPNWLYIIIIASVSVLCYSNSYNAAFVFDDSEAVVNNHDVNLKTPVIKIFSHDFWGTRLTNHASHKSYRPLTILSFRFNVWLDDGSLSPKSFHLTNIILHAIISCQLLLVYNLLFDGRAPKTSFLSALMFAVHPVHVEVVSGVVGRADLLSTCLSLIVFNIYHRTANAKQITTITNIIAMSFCCIISIMAMLCKEQGLMIMTFCGVYEIIVINKISFQSLKQNINTVKKIRLLKRKSLERLFLLTVGFCVILYGRWTIMESPPVFQIIDNPASFLTSPIERFINYSYIYLINIWIMICPVWLCFDWSMGCIPLITFNTFPNDQRLYIVFGFWVILIFVLYKLLFSKNHDQKQIQLGFLLGLLSFLPASNLMFTVGFVIAERVLYLPSAGFIVIVVLGIRKLCLNSFVQKIVGICIMFLILVHSIRTYTRSDEWSSELKLFQSALHVCPMNAKVHYNLAKSLADIGHTQEAINRYKHALILHPKYDQAMNNLANILKDQNKLEEARSLLEKAVSIRIDFAAAWMNLGIVLSAQQKYNKAENAYLKALQHRKIYPHCYFNLGNLYLEMGEKTKALFAWQNATFQQPTHVISWNNIIVLLESIGELKRAENVARTALSILPNEPNLHFNLANILGKMDKFVEAEKHFLSAIQLKHFTSKTQVVALYHSNLGVLYHRWEKYDLAEIHYIQALKVDPKIQKVKNHLTLLQKHLDETNQSVFNE